MFCRQRRLRPVLQVTPTNNFPGLHFRPCLSAALIAFFSAGATIHPEASLADSAPSVRSPVTARVGVSMLTNVPRELQFATRSLSARSSAFYLSRRVDKSSNVGLRVQNIAGGYMCTACPVGYEGSGRTGCVDVDECSRQMFHCDSNAVCVNTMGSYRCACKPGVSHAPCYVLLTCSYRLLPL
jgi:hypothetical protein